MLDKIAAMKERTDTTTQFRLTAARLRAINADLLAALEALLNEVEQAGNANADDYGWPTVVPQARAAIAKAKGD